MYLDFIDNDHEDNFYHLIAKAGSSVGDSDRRALFYIIAGSYDLNSKVDALYDFEKCCINKSDWQERDDFSRGIAKLVTLAFNLYNGYECNPYDIFAGLDCLNRELAHRAIRVRFDY